MSFNILDDDLPPAYDPRAQTQTVFKVQLYVCTSLGLLIFALFCFVRYKFPIVYSIRPYRNKKIKKLPNDFFSWIKILYQINSDELLQVAGLDSYVFLCFFRMSIKILFTLSILGITLLSPLRYFLTGQFEKDESFNIYKFAHYCIESHWNFNVINILKKKGDGSDPEDGEPAESESFLLICALFTYIFTALVYYFLFKETVHVIRMRQRCLGSQRSLTDRTIYISNIPNVLKEENTLKDHIETLGIGKVESVHVVHNYSELRKLFNERDSIIHRLEVLYSRYHGLDIHIFSKTDIPSTTLKTYKSCELPKNGDIIYSPGLNSFDDRTPLLKVMDSTNNEVPRPKMRLSFFGEEIDAINYYSKELVIIDEKIKDLKSCNKFEPSSHAFVIMDNVKDAQMAAQAVFSPNVFQLITRLAPAPMDVNWDNLLIKARALFIRKNVIEVLIFTFSVLLIIPIRYISSLLNVNSIKKMWPEFGNYLLNHDTVRTVVVGLLPTYLFTLINVTLPYGISFLSGLQGLISKVDVQLEVIKKNFLYIFFNLFLVFTLFGTLSSYKALLSDTTKIAPLLAASMKSLSLFYVDLILLQGLTMFPFKLLQVGDLFLIFWQYVLCSTWQTPRDYRNLFYKPTVFDVGLILPQHILILIITIIYSVISTKIVSSGLVYFILGFYVYKYQLVYSMVHLQHSTGKVWPIIFRRVCLGLFFFHLTMFGTFALERSFISASLIVPLFPTTIIALIFFNNNYSPLLHYIALDAIKTSGESVDIDTDDSPLALTAQAMYMTGETSIVQSGSSSSLNDVYLNSDAPGLVDVSGISRYGSISNGPNYGSIRATVGSSNPTNAQTTTSSNVNSNNNSNVQVSHDQSTYNKSAQNNSQNNIIFNTDTLGGNESVTMSSADSDSTYSQESGLPNSNNNRTNMSVLNTPNINLKKRRSTIDEEREATMSYIYPCLSDPMDGPWIGFVGSFVDTIQYFLVMDNGREETLNGLISNPDEFQDEISSVIVRKKTTPYEYD